MGFFSKTHIQKLYELYFESMYRSARRFVNKENAEDIVQNAFCYLMSLPPEKTDPALPQTKILCYSVVRSFSLNWLRDHKRELLVDFTREEKLFPEEADFSLADDEEFSFNRNHLETIWAELETPERLMDSDVFGAALRKLPVRYRDVLRLRYEVNLKTAEIARIMETKESTVLRVLSRSRAAVKKLLEEQNKAPEGQNSDEGRQGDGRPGHDE